MKTEREIEKMKEILHKEVELQMKKGLTIKDKEVIQTHSMLGALEMVLRDDLNLIFSEDFKNQYWFITQNKNKFIISATIDKNRESDKKRKEEGNYFKEKIEALDALLVLTTALRKNREKLEEE
jgi:hypothetical protein|nr:MAG TPA: hypothetical protein [Caudoviricetes sp.]